MKEEELTPSRPEESAAASSKPAPIEGSCHFFIDRKKRYCRFRPAKESNFCAEHRTAFQNESGRKRMLCPYDSKHTCYVDKLTHHMNRCPSRPKDMPAYYSKSINSGDNGGEVVPDAKVTVHTVSEAELENMVDKVNKLYDAFIKDIPTNVLSHPCLREELENTTYGTAALRHRKQMASIIGHLKKLDLLKDGLCYVEMGAGKGQLTHWVHRAVETKEDTCFVLIDRSHVRNKICTMDYPKFIVSNQKDESISIQKMDNLHKEEDIMKRYRMDIEDLKLGSVPAVESENRPVVTYGKHLCGPATDLALRCATETLLPCTEPGDNSHEEPQRKKHKSGERTLSGCVIALCCHHRCTWPAYVGKKFFRDCGLSASDFQLLSSMSSWATCTWKGWSHTKMSEEDQMTTGSDVTIGNEHLNSDESHINSCDKTDSHESKEGGIDSHESVISNQNAVPSCTQTENQEKQNEKATKTDETEVGLKVPYDKEVKENTNKSIKVQLTEKERETIGRRCKQLIDFGRVKYLEDHGLISNLNIYIEDFYTPENVVLLAKLK